MRGREEEVSAAYEGNTKKKRTSYIHERLQKWSWNSIEPCSKLLRSLLRGLFAARTLRQSWKRKPWYLRGSGFIWRATTLFSIYISKGQFYFPFDVSLNEKEEKKICFLRCRGKRTWRCERSPSSHVQTHKCGYSTIQGQTTCSINRSSFIFSSHGGLLN